MAILYNPYNWKIKKRIEDDCLDSISLIANQITKQKDKIVFQNFLRDIIDRIDDNNIRLGEFRITDTGYDIKFNIIFTK